MQDMVKLVCSFLLTTILFSYTTGSNHLQQEIIGKCLYYQSTVNPGPFAENPKNCTLLWELFKKAFAYQPVCNVSRERYREFIESGFHLVPKDKSVFWEHVYETVMRYSNRGNNLFAIADTLYGFIGDSLKWCGNSSEPDGIERHRQTCPGYDINPGCPASAEASFWTIASEYYSKHARGNVKIMLDAEAAVPFSRQTYFAKWELPNLLAPNVTSASILLVHAPNVLPKQTCEGHSVRELKNILKGQGVTSTCTINQRDVKFLLCSNNPGMTGCKCSPSVNRGNAEYSQKFNNILTAIISIVFIFKVVH